MSEKTRTTHDTITDVYESKLVYILKEDVKDILASANVSSREELRILFNRKHGVDISPSVFKEWLDKAGVTFSRAVSVNIA